MDSSWKNLQIRMEAAWNMRTTPKTKRPKTGDIISSAHSLDWNKKKVRQLQQQWNDEVTKLVADRNKAISDIMVDILTLIRMDIKSASSVLISHDAAKMLWEQLQKEYLLFAGLLSSGEGKEGSFYHYRPHRQDNTERK